MTTSAEVALDGATDTRTRILAAAADRIAHEGLAAVRMATIAKAAGVSTALLHYHFDTKERLFAEVLAYSYDASSNLDQEVLRGAGRTPSQRLAAYLDRCLPIDEALVQDWLLWQELALMYLRQPNLAGVGTDLYDRLYSTVGAIIDDGIESGDFHCDDSRFAAQTAIAICDGLGNRVLSEDPGMTLADARRIVATAVGSLVGHDGPLPMPGVRKARLPRARTAGIKSPSITEGKR